jgi:hypothetical protein
MACGQHRVNDAEARPVEAQPQNTRLPYRLRAAVLSLRFATPISIPAKKSSPYFVSS